MYSEYQTFIDTISQYNPRDDRERLRGDIDRIFSHGVLIGCGTQRVAVYFPNMPHRNLTEQEKEKAEYGIVIKFSHTQGYSQTESERKFWEGEYEPFIPREYLTPAFDYGSNDNWIAMPKRLVGELTEDEVKKLLEDILGYIPSGDISVPHHWGLTEDGNPELYDYGHLPVKH